MRTQIYLKTLTELYATIQSRMTDIGNELAGAPSYYAGINEAIEMWGNRITAPHVYSLANGFTSGIYEYDLPSFVHPPFTVQIQSSTYNEFGAHSASNATAITWHDVSGYTVEPQSNGSYKLRLPVAPYSDAGRIFYYTENGPLITTAVTLTGAITALSTSIPLTVVSGPPVGEAGYVKIANNLVGYSGITLTSATSYTLLNCVQGLNGTLAASASAGTTVTWAVGVDDPRLWIQMYDYVTAYIHGIQMHKGTTEDINRHEKLMSYYQQKADNFWRAQGYVGQKKGKAQLTPRGIGALQW